MSDLFRPNAVTPRALRLLLDHLPSHLNRNTATTEEVCKQLVLNLTTMRGRGEKWSYAELLGNGNEEEVRGALGIGVREARKLVGAMPRVFVSHVWRDVLAHVLDAIEVRLEIWRNVFLALCC